MLKDKMDEAGYLHQVDMTTRSRQARLPLSTHKSDGPDGRRDGGARIGSKPGKLEPLSRVILSDSRLSL
jgi:hypothetical protein